MLDMVAEEGIQQKDLQRSKCGGMGRAAVRGPF